MGKFHYRPPEGIYRPKMYDHRWDVFQLGLVFWSLLCDCPHPYIIDSSHRETIENPESTYTERVGVMFLMQVKNLGVPTAREWSAMYNFSIPNVEVSGQDENLHRQIIDGFRRQVEEQENLNVYLNMSEQEMRDNRQRMIYRRIRDVNPNSVYLQQGGFLEMKFYDSSYLDILVDMLQFLQTKYSFRVHKQNYHDWLNFRPVFHRRTG
jgi:hypothetical protein